MRCLKLPFHFDPERLQADLAQVAANEWIPHVNRRHYDGEWSGAALRSIGGTATNIIPDAPDLSAFQDTDLLRRCGYFQKVLGTFHCPLQAVRLLRLHAGSNIAEHIDQALDFEEGEVRIHVPIVTNDQVKFYLDGARLVMAPGECWYTNVNLPHSVENRSTTDRIHLVLDCRVNDWLREIFASTPRPAAEHYSAELALPIAPDPAGVIAVMSDYAAQTAGKLRVEPATLVVQWKEQHTWQLRLRPEGSRCWTGTVETSPDPERRHQAHVEAFLAAFTRAFPDLQIARQNLA